MPIINARGEMEHDGEGLRLDGPELVSPRGYENYMFCIKSECDITWVEVTIDSSGNVERTSRTVTPTSVGRNKRDKNGLYYTDKDIVGTRISAFQYYIPADSPENILLCSSRMRGRIGTRPKTGMVKEYDVVAAPLENCANGGVHSVFNEVVFNHLGVAEEMLEEMVKTKLISRGQRIETLEGMSKSLLGIARMLQRRAEAFELDTSLPDAIIAPADEPPPG